MSRRPVAVAAIAVLLLTALVPVVLGAKAPKNPPPAENKDPESATATFSSVGEIVDCSDYLFLGKKGSDRRDVQARHVDSGMPACFIADVDHDVYLLLDLEGQARMKFQPIENWLANDVMIQGVVYQKGSLKAIAIDTMSRLGAYSDRQSRRPKNPEPNRRTNLKPPKESSTNPAP